MFQRSSLRYAHTNGYTNVTYTENAEFIITCGSDGDIRRWKGIDDDDPTSNCLGEFVICVVHYGERLLASTDLNTVQAYTFPDIDRDGTEMRFTAPVTCIKSRGNYIAAGSEDQTIKVVTKDKCESEFQLDGHIGPILALDISCKDLLASISGDGSLKIWDLKTKKEMKTITGLPKLKTFEDAMRFGTPSFEPTNGKSLAYAKGKEIIVCNTETWDVQFTLTDDQVTSDYSCCQFSANGEFIAAGTRIGEISVFHFASKEARKCETQTSDCNGITSIAWNPKNCKEIAFCDRTGQLGTIVSDGGVSDGGINFLDTDADVSEHLFDGYDDLPDGAGQDDGDADNENCISLEKLKNETMKVNGINLIGDDDDDERSKDSNAKNSYRSVSVERPIGKIYKQQAPFQPGSTPADLEHRYLVWNNVGIVRAHADTGDGSIDIEFHDVSVHHSLHMINYNNHTMASLSTAVLALSGESSTKLVCIALAASGNKEWSMEMPDCEGIVALAATTKFVAVATDLRFLRIFTVMGTQREVLSIPGPVLALAGFHDQLIVCYHSAPADDDQHISAILLRAIGLTLRTREIRIPLITGRRMTWLGYSDCGSPAFSDNMGLVQMYSTKTNCWYPVCDTMKHSQSVSNNFFIIDVSERTQLIQAVLCRGCSYPMTNPRPMATELPMQIPLCDIESEKSLLEETLFRSSNFDVEYAEKAAKETAIKLFAIACRAELEARAKELIEMIASPALLSLAVKYASKLGRIHLSDKLADLLPQLEEQNKEREKELRESESDAFGIIQNSPLSASLLLMHSAKANANSNAAPAPKLAPKPMVISNNQKRNPFKRSTASSNNSSSPAAANPSSNDRYCILQDKRIDFGNGFESSSLTSSTMSSNTVLEQETKENSESIDVVGDCRQPVNGNLSSPPKKSNFMQWFAKNKVQLLKTHPNASTAELAKIGMREFKATCGGSSSSSSSSNPFAAKRKVDDIYNSPPSTSAMAAAAAAAGGGKSSAAAKLAKFDFKRQN